MLRWIIENVSEFKWSFSDNDGTSDQDPRRDSGSDRAKNVLSVLETEKNANFQEKNSWQSIIWEKVGDPWSPFVQGSANGK